MIYLYGNTNKRQYLRDVVQRNDEEGHQRDTLQRFLPAARVFPLRVLPAVVWTDLLLLSAFDVPRARHPGDARVLVVLLRRGLNRLLHHAAHPLFEGSRPPVPVNEVAVVRLAVHAVASQRVIARVALLAVNAAARDRAILPVHQPAHILELLRRRNFPPTTSYLVVSRTILAFFV